MSGVREQAKYLKAFNERLKTKAREDFRLVLCDLSGCNKAQKVLLEELLFDKIQSKDGHKKAVAWRNYIDYTTEHFCEQKAQLQRLVNKALELVAADANNEDYVKLHLHSANLKADDTSSLHYIENVMLKKSIGKFSANVYIRLAEYILRKDGKNTAMEVLQKGLDIQAKPEGIILAFMEEHNLTLPGTGASAGEKRSSSSSTSSLSSEEKTEELSTSSKDSDSKCTNNTGSSEGTTTTSSSSQSHTSEITSETEAPTAVNVKEKKSSLGDGIMKASAVPNKKRNRITAGKGLLGVGKCKRIARDEVGNAGEEEDENDAGTLQANHGGQSFMTEPPTPTATATVTVNINASSTSILDTSTASASTITMSKKNDLSKYVDDKLLNFNPFNRQNQKKITTESASKIIGSAAGGGNISVNNMDKKPTAKLQTPLSKQSGTPSGVSGVAASCVSNKPFSSFTPAPRSSIRPANTNTNTNTKTGFSTYTASMIDNSVFAETSFSSIDSSFRTELDTDTTTTQGQGIPLDVSRTMDVSVCRTKNGISILDESATAMQTAEYESATADLNLPLDVSVCETKESVSRNNNNNNNNHIQNQNQNQNQSQSAVKPKRIPLADKENEPIEENRAKRRVSFANKSNNNNNNNNNNNADYSSASANKENLVNRIVEKSAAEKQNILKERPSVNVEKSNVVKQQQQQHVVNQKQELSIFNDSSAQIILNDKVYTQIGILGKGGSSCVYRIINEKGQLYAFKKVLVSGNDDSDAVFDSYTNEIDLLHRLKGSPCIIELVDAEINREEMYIAMIMEAGEIDLSKVLKDRQNQTNGNKGGLMNPFFSRMVWQEMLEAVDHIHENRIVHGDLKPANFVFVKGHLKLIDFGIAKAISNDTTNIYRESQIGTINYMAPEAIAPCIEPSTSDEDEKSKMKLGRASDIWSLGCILYQIIYGRPPFAALNTIQKLHSIPNPKYEISFPTKNSFNENVDVSAIDSIKVCLIRNPRLRVTIGGEEGLLDRAYLNFQKHTADITTYTLTATLDLLKSKLGSDASKVLSTLDRDELINEIQNGVLGAK